uniref:Arginine kinase n=1 Tax=Biomphalaria glabrata TaxID=6526 RepID=A0A2C9JC99_BIOGL
MACCCPRKKIMPQDSSPRETNHKELKPPPEINPKEKTSDDSSKQVKKNESKMMEKLTLDELWARLCDPPTECNSLLKKHLTQESLDDLRELQTKFGGKLEDCIRSGCENTDSGVGVYASDPDAYTVFAPLLDAVIKDYHKVSELNHPNPDFGDVDKLDFGDLDPEGNLIVSTRVRVGRSHDSYGFPPVLKLEDRVEMEKKTVEALNKLEGELKGTYYPLTGMTKETQKQLTDDHFLFNDRPKQCVEACWLSGKALGFQAEGSQVQMLVKTGILNIWISMVASLLHRDKSKVVLLIDPDQEGFVVIEEDSTTSGPVIVASSCPQESKQKSSYIMFFLFFFVQAIKALESSGLSFAKREGLGYLTFCPSNLGTTLRASVHIKIPKLSQTPDFKAFCDKYNIQARGIHGEHTESVGGVYDISNKRRLGLTEIQAIQEMRRGVEAVIAEEKKLGG